MEIITNGGLCKYFSQFFANGFRSENPARLGVLLRNARTPTRPLYSLAMSFPFRSPLLALLLALASAPLPAAVPEQTLGTDLLIVGGNESGVAAAIQAARLGVKHIILVNDIAWLGGQFSAEAVGAIDEWTLYKGKRTEFPRSGLFAEVLERIHQYNGRRYGLPRPGNGFCSSETIEPAAAAQIFEDLLQPYVASGQIQVLRPLQPQSVEVTSGAVTAVTFEDPAKPGNPAVTIQARLTIDSTDWGDVIQLSGAKWAAGPDLKSRFNEPSAPEHLEGEDANEMNPIAYCLVLRESTEAKAIPAPDHYFERNYEGIAPGQLFVDSAGAEGIYSPGNFSIYTHRRLVDRWHNHLPPGGECVLLNFPPQDYPVYHFPKHVADALEATETGASKKSIVAMKPAQRQIVFEDARRQSLGFLRYLQTTMSDKRGDYPQSFRRMKLTDEFGTGDQLPPKPYVREGLRLEALYMMREQDIRTQSESPGWAKVMVPDGVFGFQFNIDFHPTRRQFLDNDNPAGPWKFVHTQNRNWSTHTDRAMLPLRSLVPVEMNGLVGTSKNIGLSSIVSAAVRLHGQMMHCGQAAGTLAWQCLRDGRQPRDIAVDWPRIRELQQRLAQGAAGGQGTLLWPFQDLPPDDENFVAINLLTVRHILQPDADSLDFQAWKPVTQEKLNATVNRAAQQSGSEPKLAPGPATPASWKDLHEALKACGLPVSEGLLKQGALQLTRAEMARHVWLAVKDLPETAPPFEGP